MNSDFCEQFEAINGRYLSAKKAVRERDRILSLMASLDESRETERAALAELAGQLDNAKARLADLEGLTWTAVWQKLIGNHEAELSEEAEKLAALKMAHEASEIKIQTIQNSLHEFEAALVDLAECDEELTAVQTEQQAFLVANGRLPADKIHQLNRDISEGQTFLREAAEALAVGEKARQAVAELRRQLAAAKKTSLFKPPNQASRFVNPKPWSSTVFVFGSSISSYFGMGAIVTAAGEIQPLLDLFQLELYDIGYQMTPPPDLELPTYGEVMLHMKSLHQHNEDERIWRIEKWREHLGWLDKQLRQKIDVLKNKIGHRETAVHRAQTELQTLIEQHWQEAKYA